MHNKMQGGFHLLLATLLFVVLIIIGYWFYWDAASLPFSLIDDVSMFDHGKIVLSSLEQGGPVGLFADADPRFANSYRPSIDLVSAGLYLLANLRMAHIVHLALLALTCLFIMMIAYRATGTRQALGALIGSWIGAVLFLTAEIPGATDFQSLQANWFRLFTTDSYAVFFASAGCFAILCAWRAKRWWSVWPLMLIGALLLMLVIFTKLIFAPIALILLWVICCAALIRKRNAAWSAFASLILIASVICFYAGKTDLFSKGIQGQYTSQYADATSNWLGTLSQYSTLIIDQLFGIIFLWIILTLLLRYNRTIHLHPSRFIAGFFTEGMLIIGAATFFVGYLAWPHIYARYMLGTTMFLCALIGVLASQQLQAVFAGRKLTNILRNLLFILAGMAVVLICPTQYIIIVFVLLIITLWRSYGRQALHAFLLGILLLGTAYIMKTGQISSRALKADYVTAEHLRDTAVIPHIYSLWNDGKTIGVAVKTDNNIKNEVIASIADYARQKGIVPRLTPITDLSTSATKCDVLLHTSVLSPANLLPATDEHLTSGSAIFALSKNEVAIPVSFSVWRNRVLKSCGKNYSLIENKPINDTWGFYCTK
ncbi:hypothetical protein GX645_04350 [Candidatus Sumerlaeota bacterium]|nr:hypothetical protein [Candidatus Sumerlaeota bacterium]